MKTIFRLLCGWMAIALAACTGDELQQIEPLQKPVAQKTISVKAYTPSEQAATRLDFTEETDGSLSLAWSAGDAFTALIDNNKVRFEYDEDSKVFTANVNESVTLTDGLKAYYPAYTGEYSTDLSRQTGQLNGATTYMEGVYEGDAFKFTHSTAILMATFSELPQDATISSVGIDVVAGERNFQIAISQPANDLYINLPAIANDGKLTFDVRTSDGTLYTATKTVAAEKVIQTGVYYNTTVALLPAPVCNLPGYSTTEGKNLFNDAVIPFLSSKSLTKIKFVTNSDNTGENNQIGTSGAYMVAGSDKTLEIHTAAAEFVFNADCNHMFAGLHTITAIDFNNCINTANVTNMASMFSGCQKLTSLNVSSFNTANVIFMNGMFNHCSALTSLDLSSFNTANVKDMANMFNFCSSLTSLDLSSFNTEKVTSMASMFYFCLNISELDLSSFVFKENVILAGMFTGLGSEVTNKPIPVYAKSEYVDMLNDSGKTNINSNYAIVQVKQP